MKLDLLFLIPSRNRACQLHALLTSIKDTFKYEPEFHIIYSASNTDFHKGYEKLKKMELFSKTTWYEESNLYQDFLARINNKTNDYICLCSDDSIFFRNVDITNEDLNTIFDEKTICFNFRLGFNTIVQDYMCGARQPSLTQYEEFDKFVRWNYKRYTDVHNYGYPFSFDGHVHRMEDLNHYTRLLALDTGKIRHWEGRMNGAQHRHLVTKELMCCYKHSVMFNNPVNCVQDPPLYSSPNVHIPPEELNRMFLEGQIINVAATRNLDVIGSHQEWAYQFKNI